MPQGSAKPSGITDEAATLYIERRLKPQRDWFGRRAILSKRYHQALIGVQTVSTASIPVLNMITVATHNTGYTYVSTIAAAISGLAAAYSGHSKFREHWLRYRNTATLLENLQLDYELRLTPFDAPDANRLLITSVRKVLDDEQSSWATDVRSALSFSPMSANAKAPSLSGSGNEDDDQ